MPFWPLDPGSGLGFSGPGSQSHIFESLVTIFWVKSSIILWKLAQIFFFSTSKLKKFSILWNLWLHKKVWQIFFSPFSFVAVFGSGIRDGKKSGSEINIPDPQHCLAPYDPIVLLLLMTSMILTLLLMMASTLFRLSISLTSASISTGLDTFSSYTKKHNIKKLVWCHVFFNTQTASVFISGMGNGGGGGGHLASIWAAYRHTNILYPSHTYMPVTICTMQGTTNWTITVKTFKPSL